MRFLPVFAPVFALVAAAACTPVQQAQVSKNTPLENSTGLSLPAMQGFAGSAGSATQRSNVEIAKDFLDLEFRMESGRAIPVLSRFEGPITVALRGDVPTTAPAELARLISRFRTEAGIDISPAAAGEDASVTIDFQPRAQLQRVVPAAACFVVPRVRSFAEYKVARNSPEVDWTSMTVREHVAIFVPSDTSPQEVRDCLHEELAQAMGPLNDLYRLPDSVFNDDNFNTVLTGFDMLILRMHYAPDLKSGMNEAEAAKHIPALLARLNPAGEGLGGAPAHLSPRAWISAVEAAFGPHGSAASRRAAAQKMLSISAAQGWRDGRMAFSFYAMGRTQVARDPQAAIAAFDKAGRIYRAIPGAQIHAAHVDMQLAAVALSTGQAEQAIAFADRAIPVVKRAENAALLATLLLIKAEALETLGQPAEARALRLDSLGWARYGFGSEQQVRARMSEIAALGSRGRNG
jgi:hypothetical protein